MDVSAKPQEMEIQAAATNSPKGNGSSARTPTPTPPVTPRVITRQEPSTTFIQADSVNFKQVVQLLTGSSETAKLAATNKTSAPNSDPLPSSPTKNNIPPIKTGQKKQGSKLYERRNNVKNALKISPLNPDAFGQNSSFSPRKLPEILSPSILDFPSLVLSPVTPLNADTTTNNKTVVVPYLTQGGLLEEEKAIAEKKFYLHPSPRTTPRGSAPPQLLPLFPMTSPRFSGSCSSDRNEVQTMCI